MKTLAALLIVGAAARGDVNEMHYILASADEPQRQKMFAALMNRIGEPCLEVTRTFFQGTDKRGDAHWSITCAGGKDLGVSLSNRNNGSVRAVECRILEKAAKSRCFTKF